MADQQHNPAGPINATINDLMGKPVDLGVIEEAAIYGTQVWEDHMDEVQAEAEAQSFDPEPVDYGEDPAPAEADHADAEQVSD